VIDSGSLGGVGLGLAAGVCAWPTFTDEPTPTSIIATVRIQRSSNLRERMPRKNKLM
jgi:hypothetical protein